MRHLSKSKLIAFRQCPRRIWLEVHHPELRSTSAGTEAAFRTGYQVGGLARQLYDPDRTGTLIDAQTEGFKAAFARSTLAMTQDKPVFEAGFAADGALAFADVMLPVGGKGARRKSPAWRMIEIKASTKVADYHRDDVAIQAFVARRAGVPLTAISLATIDSQWVYPGGGDYRGILVEHDLTTEAFAREQEVAGWVGDAQKVVAKRSEPAIATGRHCNDPFECGFIDHCRSSEPQAEFPVAWIPRASTKALKAHLEQPGVLDLRDVPDHLLNPTQLRVKNATVANQQVFDAAGAAGALAPYKLPAYFLDFETVNQAVPIWKGTRPYQQVPFQFSCHRLSRTGKLEHRQFLDLTGTDPSRSCAQALIDACGETGPVFVYNMSFEATRIAELAARFTRLARPLLAIRERLVDLKPIAENHFYHPSQQGSWSIKAVLPAMVPSLSYDALDGVQNGGLAVDAYLEAIAPETAASRRDEIERQLTAYCALDTLAMVKIWEVMTGRQGFAAETDRAAD